MGDYRLRSHKYTDLTNYEIEKYLEHNDIILIPVGNCETHAGYPVDSEFVITEGYAHMMAEKLNAIYLPDVVYFNPGGTQIGRGTIHVSMSASFQYTKELAHSLLNQGFKRQIWLPSHVPTTDFLIAMLTEFFDETKVPMLFFDPMAYFRNIGIVPPMSFDPNAPKPKTPSGKEVNPFDDVMLAGYKLAGRLDAVPAKGEVDFPEAEQPQDFFPDWFPEYRLLGQCCSFMAAPAPYYYAHPDEHIGPPIAWYTREELEEHAATGIEFMQDLMDRGRLDELMTALSHLQEYEAEIVKKHYDHLPKNKYSPVSPF